MSALSLLAIAVLTGVVGTGAAVAGVYMLCGSGWALLAAAALLFFISFVLLRGVPRAE